MFPPICWDDHLYFPFPCRCKCHFDAANQQAFVARHHESCCSQAPCGSNVVYGAMKRHILECTDCRRILFARMATLVVTK